MKTVKTFANLAEAGFASSLLEAAGIPAALVGEQAFLYTAGVWNTGLRLEVEDQDFDWAIRVLTEGLDTPPPPPSSEPAAEEGQMPTGLFVAVVAALALLGFGVYQWNDQKRTSPMRDRLHTYERDYNEDGRPDHFYTYEGGVITRVTVDRNHDGRIDKWESFDGQGRPAHMELDENFDGQPDLYYFYEKGEVVRSEQDSDFNGKPDWFGFYKDGILTRLDCRPDGSSIIVRRLIYVHGILTEEWVDEDRDGKFDYKILRDPFGAMSEKIPIKSER